MDYRSVLTTCPYCGCGCGLYLEVVDGRIVQTLPSKTSPVNRGRLCIKGWNAHEFVHHPRRLTRPLIRRGDGQVEASWDEALDAVASELKRIKETYGPDSVALFSSAKCTNEENYLLQKFARAAIGTNNVDHCARL
ncbi:Molybdopterin oxidoreductase [Desulfacinum hydrothermale DSM 13146]|nr:Molybdopterin oxidoreductase [Desulfacinum hydrothermale DSM 13146]